MQQPQPSPPPSLPPEKGKETREVITPFAFATDATLMGQPLARPWRRGLALAIDGLLIIGLANLNVLWLLGLSAVFFARQARHRRRQLLKYIFASLSLGLVLLGATQVDDAIKQGSQLDRAIATGDSATFEALVERQLSANADCDRDCRDIVRQTLQRELQSKGVNIIPEARAATNDERDQANPEDPRISQYQQDIQALEQQINTLQQRLDTPPGLIAIGTQLVQDLGLGVGWSAFYFTLFTAWWKGQTPGKRLLKIRVVQLDGTPLSLWDAFGRYGGYGAGIATGLLGFLQIYWDPNRQAIQDKISATVVVRG